MRRKTDYIAEARSLRAGAGRRAVPASLPPGRVAQTAVRDPISAPAPPATQPPVAAFAAGTSSGPAPLSVQFTDLSLGAPTAWAWSFGDGGVSTRENPLYVYQSPGTYSVTLTASNAGGSSTAVRASLVTVASGGYAPGLDFSDARNSQYYFTLFIW